MAGLGQLIEAGIRFPGFAFINVQSPCITYGEPDQQLKSQKSRIIPLESLGHDPANRLRAMELAQDYGTKLYTGVFFRDPEPDITYDAEARQRHAEMMPLALQRTRILDMFQPRG
jgi:2-oxoglutarate ferredoxin oxidoreductase subunit beta